MYGNIHFFCIFTQNEDQSSVLLQNAATGFINGMGSSKYFQFTHR